MKIIEFLLYTLIFSFCLGQFGRVPGFSSEVNIYIWDVLAALLIFAWLCLKLGVEKRLRFAPFGGQILLFSSLALISLVNGKRWIEGGEWVAASGYWIRWVVYAGVYFVVWDLKNQITNYESRISNLLILSGVILATLGFAQLVVFPNLSELDPQFGWDPHQGRMFSTWLDPNFLGAYFVLCLSLLTGRLFGMLEDDKHASFSSMLNTRYLILYTCFLVLVTSLMLTFSRSAWGMLAIVLGVFGIFKSRKLLLLMLALFFAAYFLVPRVQTRLAGVTDPADSASLRFISWKRTSEIIRKYPLTGIGFNAFRYAQEREGFFRDERGVPLESGHAGAGSDSSLLLVWATTGICGFLAYLWLYGSIVWQGLKRYRNNKLRKVAKSYDRFLTLALLASLASLFAESNFINSLFYPPILLWLWIVTGLVMKSV